MNELMRNSIGIDFGVSRSLFHCIEAKINFLVVALRDLAAREYKVENLTSEFSLTNQPSNQPVGLTENI